MATKLKNLKVTKVDFVDAGANPDAYIRLYKNESGEPGKAQEPEEAPKGNIFKRLFNALAKVSDDTDSSALNAAVEQIEKGGSVSFDEKIEQRKNQKIDDEIWDICYALNSSLCSILWDEDLDSAAANTAMHESLDEFYNAVKGYIDQWSNGTTVNIEKSADDITEEDLKIAKSARVKLDELIEKSTNNNTPKGEKDMIDVNKMTSSERAFYEDIVKRYTTDDTAPQAPEINAAPVDPEPAVAKNAPAEPAKAPEPTTGQEPDQGEDIYKGLNPAVKAELDALKKFREEAEDKELHEVAKKYVIIGKKEDELVPVLKSLKAAGGTAYNDMIAVLDSAVTTVEKSGAFSEIGKTGHSNGSGMGQAVGKIEDIAKKYMESDPKLDHTAAVAKAWEENPEIMDEYDEEEGF